MSETAVSGQQTPSIPTPKRTWRDAVTPAGRSSRRRWGALYAVLLLAGGALVATDDVPAGLSDRAASDTTTFVLVAMAVLFGMLRRGTRSLAAIDHPKLDERDNAARDKAFRIAYALLRSCWPRACCCSCWCCPR